MTINNILKRGTRSKPRIAEEVKTHKLSNERVKLSEEIAPLSNFNDFSVRDGLTGIGIDQATTVQSYAIPALVDKRDVMVCAPTGSGKTLAFLIPILELQKQNNHVLGLVIAPTKELAMQIYRVAYSLYSDVSLLQSSTEAVTSKLVVGTPLTILNSIKAGHLDLQNLEYLILDEADILFQDQFILQTDEIMALCKKLRTTGLFSATIPSNIEELAQTVMRDPVRIVVGTKDAANKHIQQSLVFSGNEKGKVIALRNFMTNGELKPPTLIFVSTTERALKLYKEIRTFPVQVMSSSMGEKRQAILDAFHHGKIWCLICTELMARGIDFKGINLVINFDIPTTVESYVHRIGRTGRGGVNGKAITFYTKEDQAFVKLIVNAMKVSGMPIQDWMNQLPDVSKRDRQKLRTMPVKRGWIDD